MANPQLENGYTSIANEIMEALAKIHIPGRPRQILDFIFRKTYGYHKKEDKISNSQFVKFTGMNKSQVCKSINVLLSMNIVVKKDNGGIPSYCFNKDFDTWKVLSKKTTVVKKDNGVVKKDNNRCQKRQQQNIKDTYTKDIYICKFNEFYSLYPRKKAKKKALEAWMKLDLNDELFAMIIASLKLDIKSKEWKKENGQFIPLPSTWINGKRWEDSHEIEIEKDSDDGWY